MNFIEELTWRGMVHDLTPGLEKHLHGKVATGYIGFDPTSDSLHIGNLMQIMLLRLFQAAGHKPIALVGGATGMIGDPSGKAEERKLLAEEEIRHNEKCIETQLRKLLDFDCEKNGAELVNNYDWLKNFNLFGFSRDVGKHITVNYMMAKESIKNRMESGISFAEFFYQLLQAYDFYWLFQNKSCTLQMGGSDQWGNITSGIELIRKKCSGETFGITSPLLLKPDGSKFGKTETGNIWLDASRTSPYKFYQFWLNISDEEAFKCFRIFSSHGKEETETMEAQHKQEPEKRVLQRRLGEELTCRIHSRSEFEKALSATEVLFGDGPVEALKNFSDSEFENIFEGVPRFSIGSNLLENGLNVVDFLSQTGIFPSKSDARRTIKGGGLSVNKAKITDESLAVSKAFLLNNRYILVQKGRKNYFLVKAE